MFRRPREHNSFYVLGDATCQGPIRSRASKQIVFQAPAQRPRTCGSARCGPCLPKRCAPASTPKLGAETADLAQPQVGRREAPF
jgi:hypothetical protein